MFILIDLNLRADLHDYTLFSSFIHTDAIIFSHESKVLLANFSIAS